MAEAVHLEGFKELDRMLKQLPVKMETRVLKAAVLAGLKGAVTKSKAKARVIKDSGALAKSIKSETLKKRRRSSPYVVATAGPRKDAKASNGEWCAKYGMVVEFGFSDTGISPGGIRRKGWKKRYRGSLSRGPYPFMRSSLAEQAPYVLRDMQRNIGKKIEKEAAKLAKR
jgi:hypothetical protein